MSGLLQCLISRNNPPHLCCFGQRPLAERSKPELRCHIVRLHRRIEGCCGCFGSRLPSVSSLQHSGRVFIPHRCLSVSLVARLASEKRPCIYACKLVRKKREKTSLHKGREDNESKVTQIRTLQSFSLGPLRSSRFSI